MTRIHRITTALICATTTQICVADHITTPTYFNGLNTNTIDFETAPGDTELLPNATEISDLYEQLGVRFSSEMSPGSNTFDAPMRSLAAVSGGGFPSSGERYAGGWIFAGNDCSAQRVEFVQPVSAFGMWVIDNDFTDVRVSAYNSSGALIESIFIPTVDEGGFGYHGIAAPDIAYFILDHDTGGLLDSTYIDQLTYIVGPCSDDVVDVEDLLLLLSYWGPCDPGCIMDLDGNNAVDVSDLLALLAAWGSCL